MYVLDKEKNYIHKLKERTFSELNFKERQHLQEWIVNTPTVFDEDLLIIQKEFSGFADTNERLDLLAIDKQGDLVIIENKLDDTGKDVTWQALKYTSYCSSLSKENITQIYQNYLDKYLSGQNAIENLTSFFDDVEDFEEIQINKGLTQRIIFVAANFRKEVTSTVLWLLNYKIRMQCFKVTPYSREEQLFFTFDQIIPIKDAEEFMIGMAEKSQDEVETKTKLKNRHILRREFWTKFLDKINKESDLFNNLSTSTENWLSIGSGLGGVPYAVVITKSNARVEVYINTGSREKNKNFFDELHKQKNIIEESFGFQLIWERLDDKQTCRIKSEEEFNYYNKDSWPEIIEFLANKIVDLEKAFAPHLSKLKNL